MRFAAAVRKAESDGCAGVVGVETLSADCGEQSGILGRATAAAMERQSRCCVRLLRKCASVAGVAQFASPRAHVCARRGGLTRVGERYRL